jgi:hypothetical protein
VQNGANTVASFTRSDARTFLRAHLG